MSHADEDRAIRIILEGTAAETGERFFAALVQSLAQALEAAGAWVTEYLPEPRRLRAFSFWFEDRYIDGYEYDIRGSPCEMVIDTASLVHYPENIVALFPADPDLSAFRAVSYLGVPLQNAAGDILGHLAVLDTKPLPLSSRVEAVFRIFAARAAAELQRLRAESRTREREEKLSTLMNSAMDAIIELDRDLMVTEINRSGATVLGGPPGDIVGRDFRDFLTGDSRGKLERLAGAGNQNLWIPGGLQAVRLSGEPFPAEATLSRFHVRGRGHQGRRLRPTTRGAGPARTPVLAGVRQRH